MGGVGKWGVRETRTLTHTPHHPSSSDCLSAFMLQVAILSNHQNGRDTHVRGARVYAPAPDSTATGAVAAGGGGGGVAFTTAEALAFASVR